MAKKILVSSRNLQYWAEMNNPSLLDEWDEEANGGVKPCDVFANSNIKYWWKDKFGHKFLMSPAKRIIGQGCPYCSGRKVLKGFNDLASQRPDIALQWDYERNGFSPDTVTVHSSKKVWWKCPVCGQSYQATIDSRTRYSLYKNNCPYENGKAVLKGHNDLASRFPEIAAEWDHDKNGSLTPDMVTASSSLKVWWICPKGHSYQATIYSRTHRGFYKNSCPYCSGNKVLKEFNDLASQRPDLAAEWDFERNGDVTPDMVTCGSSKKFYWICPNCGYSYRASVEARVRGSGCPVEYACSHSLVSKVIGILMHSSSPFRVEARADDSDISNLPFDIEAEDAYIEIDGPQHFRKSYGHFTDISLDVRVKRDNLRDKYCLDSCRPLLRIPYCLTESTEELAEIITEFLKTHVVPDLILEFYRDYKDSIGSTYYDTATALNKIAHDQQ